MNKLEGFYELKKHGLPCMAWQAFTGHETLDPSLLWTVRVAVAGDNDFNLPRAIGVPAAEALKFGRELLAKYESSDLIIFYPYYVAIKSGIIEMQAEQTVIEAVAKDLWNLTNLGRKDLTVIINELTGDESRFGNTLFLDQGELTQLQFWARKMRLLYRELILSGDTLLLEWSFAVDTNVQREILNEMHLLFTECKSVQRGQSSSYNR